MKLRLLTLIIAVTLMPLALLARNYDMTFNDVKPEAAFQIIKKATGYEFVYNKGILSGLDNRTVAGSFQNMSLEQILDRVVALQLGLDFEVVDKTIVLSKAKDNQSYKATVSGQVLDENGDVLPGATVAVPGTKSVVATDIDGRFSIPVEGSSPRIEVSYVGMKSKLVRLDPKQTSVVVSMELDPTMMSEVVVTGYQNIKRENATGAFQQISAKDLDSRYMSSLTSNLEGKVAGMVVYDNKIQIRGTGTLNANTTPLVVVDGLPINGSLTDINPYEIEKVTILKDAAAAAIYGARASNGVIVVSTKKGLSEKLAVEFNADFTVHEKRNYDDLGLCNASELIELQEANFNWIASRPDDMTYLKNNWTTSGGTWNPLNKLMMNRYLGTVSESEYQAQKAIWQRNSYLNDWQDYMEHTRLEQRYNLSLRTKGKYLSNNITVNWFGDNTQFVDSYDNRLSLRYLGDIDATSWFKATVGLQVDNTRQKGRYYDADYTNYDDQPVYLSFYNPDGTPARLQARVDLNEPSLSNPAYGLKDEGFVPVDEMGANTSKYRETYTRGFVHLNFFPIPELKLSGMFQYEDITSKREDLQGADAYVTRHNYNLFTSNGKHLLPEGGVMNEQNYERNYYTFRAQATYDKLILDKHEINAVAGYEYRYTRDRYNQNRLWGYDERTLTNSNSIMNFYDLTKASSTDLGAIYNTQIYFLSSSVANFTDEEHKYISYYATANYTFDHRYSVSGSYRIDKADLFGADKKFTRRPLWSVGASWNMQNESFIRDITWIDMLKPRVSYGVTGNINSNYSSYLTAKIYVHGETGDKYASVNTPPNDQLRWEKTKTLNAGIDFGFFNYRLGGSFDFYNKVGSDILSLVDTDPTTGWASLNMNNACTRNRGVELQLYGDILRASHPSQVGIHAELTIAHNDNKVTKINHIATAGYKALESSDYKEGYPVNSLYSYVWDGVRTDESGYQHIYWKKADGTSNCDALTSKSFDVTDVVFSGSLDPKWSGSFTPSVSYQRFTLSAMAAFYLGHYFRPNYNKWFYTSSYGANAPKAYLDYWRATPEARETMLGSGSVMRNTEVYWDDVPMNTLNVAHADYLKLRNIVLTYDFAENICKKIGLSGLRLRAQVNNVATWVRNGEGLDPERVDAQTGIWNFGTPRSYTFSINANF